MNSFPYYVFNVNQIKEKIQFIRNKIGEISLTFSIKANPFVTKYIVDFVDYVEVCSPGELHICKTHKVNPKKIIYSGVMKEYKDILEAVEYGVAIVTLESLQHYKLLTEVIEKTGKTVECIIRITSGNQFGMSLECAEKILSDSNDKLNCLGFHLYSGTQKIKDKKFEQDFNIIDSAINLWCSYKEEVPFIEYGPGLSVDYFKDNDSEEILGDFLALYNEKTFNAKIGIELGRFIAAECGEYHTKVKDIKHNDGVNYVILDGGMHHIKYYGQTFGMQIPPIEQINNDSQEKDTYCLCGSLCTVADVLVRSVELNKLEIEDELVFKCCGAYSMLEGPLLFLSRDMPGIYIKIDKDTICSREYFESYRVNL